MTPFPWGAAMGFGLGVLRLAPRDFWAMSPRELVAAYRAVTGSASAGQAPARERLSELMARFPDGEKSNGGT